MAPDKDSCPQRQVGHFLIHFLQPDSLYPGQCRDRWRRLRHSVLLQGACHPCLRTLRAERRRQMPEKGTQKRQANGDNLQRRVFNWTDIQHKRLSQWRPVQKEPIRHDPCLSEYCKAHRDICKQGWRRIPDRSCTVHSLEKQLWRKGQLSPFHHSPGDRDIFIRLCRMGRRLQTLSASQHLFCGPLGLLQWKE